jgi:hypothetical protein
MFIEANICDAAAHRSNDAEILRAHAMLRALAG